MFSLPILILFLATAPTMIASIQNVDVNWEWKHVTLLNIQSGDSITFYQNEDDTTRQHTSVVYHNGFNTTQPLSTEQCNSTNNTALGAPGMTTVGIPPLVPTNGTMLLFSSEMHCGGGGHVYVNVGDDVKPPVAQPVQPPVQSPVQSPMQSPMQPPQDECPNSKTSNTTVSVSQKKGYMEYCCPPEYNTRPFVEVNDTTHDATCQCKSGLGCQSNAAPWTQSSTTGTTSGAAAATMALATMVVAAGAIVMAVV